MRVSIFPLSLLTAWVLLGLGSAYSQNAQNGKIAFASDRDGQSRIYVMDPDGSSQARLTDGPGYDDLPAWSPDGGTLAFVRKAGDGSCSIYLMEASGANIRAVPNSTASCNSSIAWAPNGARIAFSYFPVLYAMNIDGTNKVTLFATSTNPFFSAIDPSWSPDGTKVAFTGPGALTYTDIWIVNADGTDPVRITHTPFTYTAVGTPSWSAHDDRIIYADASEDMGDNDRITTMRSDGSDAQHLLQFVPGSRVVRPSRSPDGQRLVFAECIYQYPVPSCRNQISVSGVGPVTSTGDNSNPSWQSLAAAVSISGRVTTSSGRAIGNVRVAIASPAGPIWFAITSPFGYFVFENIPVGNNYTITARSKLYRFEPQQISPVANVTDIDIVALP